MQTEAETQTLLDAHTRWHVAAQIVLNRDDSSYPTGGLQALCRSCAARATATIARNSAAVKEQISSTDGSPLMS